MRISIPTLENPQPTHEPEVKLTPKTFHHSIVTTEHQPLSAYLMYVEGQTVTVDYYSQFLSKSEELATPDLEQEVIYQQYRKINKLELKFDGQLSNSTDTETQVITISGSAKLYPYLRPNEGDVFIMDIGEGKAGRFTVTEVSQYTIQKETAFDISFQLAKVLTEEDFHDIERKVVAEYHFVKDFMLYGQNPLLVDSDFQKLAEAKTIFKAVTADFFNEFFSSKFNTLMVPERSRRMIYDPWVVRAFLTVFTLDDDRRVQNIREYNFAEYQRLHESSIWSVLIKPEGFKYKEIWTRAGEESVRRLNVEPYYNSLRYSGMTDYIKPLGLNNNVDDYSGANDVGMGGWSALGTSGMFSTGNGEGNAIDKDGNRTTSCYRRNYYHMHHLAMWPWDPTNHLSYIEEWQCGRPEEETEPDSCESFNDGYLIPDDAWEDPNVKDPFISIIKGHLNGDNIDLLRIINLLEKRRTWSLKDRFYKTVALLIILKVAIRRL